MSGYFLQRSGPASPQRWHALAARAVLVQAATMGGPVECPPGLTLLGGPVKVFISSVTYLLKDERENLPPLLRLIGHDALRFEDFVAPDASSRVACLRGVDAADAFVLL